MQALLKRAAVFLPLLAAMAPAPALAEPAAGPELVRIEAVSATYREAGEFLVEGYPVDAPEEHIRPDQPFEIMKRQVTRGEYGACVEAGRCRAPLAPADPALPVVGVSFDDALAYAAWLSEETGDFYRLPTDREWAIAAGSRFAAEAYGEAASDPSNPARRWIARYEAEAVRDPDLDPAPRPVGSFGENEHGLLDVSGNVWEWTSTCFARRTGDPETGEVAVRSENCGVRVAEGRHRAYMTSFFRDPKAGGCSVGIPPANLGIRLVRAERGLVDRLRTFVGF